MPAKKLSDSTPLTASMKETTVVRGLHVSKISPDEARPSEWALQMTMNNGNPSEPIIVFVGSLPSLHAAFALSVELGDVLEKYNVSAGL